MILRYEVHSVLADRTPNWKQNKKTSDNMDITLHQWSYWIMETDAW